MRAIILSVLLISCGTEHAVPTTLEADPSKGEVSVKGERGEKGEKGDRGEQGPVGPAGKDGKDGAQGAQGPKGDTGAAGTAGKDGQDQIQGIWKDTVSGKSWFLLQGKYGYASTSLCAPWRAPTVAELKTAVQHGIARILVPASAAATETAWSSESGQGVTLFEAGDANVGVVATYTLGTAMRIYCVKPE